MSKETFLAKLEKNNIRTFTLPILQEEITYRKLDVIESSVNHSLPDFLASRVLDGMKKTLGGQQPQEVEIQLEDKDMVDFLVRATETWEKLVIDPKLSMDEIVQIDAIDRIGWYGHAIAESQQAETKGGGVLTAADVETFSNERANKRNSKRSANG